MQEILIRETTANYEADNKMANSILLGNLSLNIVGDSIWFGINTKGEDHTVSFAVKLQDFFKSFTDEIVEAGIEDG